MVKIPKLFQETSLFNTQKTVEASIKLLSDSITSVVNGTETYVDPDGNARTNTMGTMIRQTLDNVVIQATRNSSNAAQAGAALITSLINVATEGITINSDKVNIEGAAIFSSGRLSQSSLNNAYDTKGSAATAKSEAISEAASDASSTYSTKSDAVSEEQHIYIQAVSGTNSINGTTTWVSSTAESVTSDTAGLTPTWTTKRPTYRSNYPVIFTAKQKKTVSGTVTCSTPIKDDTLTVIDGGHIVTGTIDASKVAVSNLSANSITTGTLDGSKATITNINASNISTGILDGSKATITNINASNIKSGTLAAARIDTAHITVGSLQDGSSYAKTADVNAAAKTASDYITKIDNNGIKVHAAYNVNANYTIVNANGLEVVKNSISMAKFGETARIGRFLKGYVEIGTNENDNGYIDMYSADVLLCHIGYDVGADASGGNSLAPYYNFGIRKASTTIGNYSCVFGLDNTASGGYSYAEGCNTIASGGYSHAEGYNTTASGSSSHAEGSRTTASGSHSHAEVYYTTASGKYSHAEGDTTTASGEGSHAEGLRTTASGKYSHAAGYYTIADKDRMTAVGGYNKGGINDVKFVVGNGDTDSSRKNAFTVIGPNGGQTTAYINGTTSANGTQVTSDARIKTLIDELSPETSINFITQLKPKHYYKEDVEEYGFYAQEVEEIPGFGEVLVKKDNSGLYDLPDYRLLNYQGLIAPIVSVEQNLIERVEKLEKENSELKEQIKHLIQIFENSK